MESAGDNNTEETLNPSLEDFQKLKEKSKEIDEKDFDLSALKSSDISSITIRNNSYSYILDSYYIHLYNTCIFKKRYRKSFIIFFLILSVLIIVALLVLIFLIFCSSFYFKVFSTEILIALVSSLISLIGSLIIIPTKLADFIYNKDEEKTISEIIKNIQDYDKEIRKNLYS